MGPISWAFGLLEQINVCVASKWSSMSLKWGLCKGNKPEKTLKFSSIQGSGDVSLTKTMDLCNWLSSKRYVVHHLRSLNPFLSPKRTHIEFWSKLYVAHKHHIIITRYLFCNLLEHGINSLIYRIPIGLSVPTICYVWNVWINALYLVLYLDATDAIGTVIGRWELP